MSAEVKGPVLVVSRVVEQSSAALGRLAEAGFQLVPNPEGASVSGDRLASLLALSEGAIVGTQTIDEAMLSRSSSLRAMVKAGVGLDNVDLVAAERHRVVVESLPGSNAEAVADHAFGLILAVARRLLEADAAVRAGRWSRFRGVDVHGKVLGLVGLGAVGRGVARRASGFSMRILGVDAAVGEAEAKSWGVELVELPRLLAEADFVSLHVPLTDATAGLIDAHSIARMKEGAIVINTARGGLVNESDLFQALSSGRLRGAGLDVFEEEPPGPTPLASLQNVVLTPHNASYSEESMEAVANLAVERMAALLGAPLPPPRA